MRIYGVPLKTVGRDLKNEIRDDNVPNGAAALAYYLVLSIFPGMIILLALLPYLPIPNLDQEIMKLLGQALPGQASQMFSGVVKQVTSQRSGGLLSFGILAALWAASNGMYAIMQQLNISYDVKEGRPFWKARGIAIALTFIFGGLMVIGLGLTIFGGELKELVGSLLGTGAVLDAFFQAFRWAAILGAILLNFSLIYYLGPDVKQKFKFITPGSVLGTVLLVAASLGFKVYVDNFGKYSATYGSIGAVIVLMLWLYIAGLVLLLGSEINSLIEHYSPEGKAKGEKQKQAA